MTYFIIAYHISLVKIQTNYRNNNLLILDVKQLNKIVKICYLHTLKALWDDQGKIKMYYGMSKVKKHLSRKSSIGKLFLETRWIILQNLRSLSSALKMQLSNFQQNT